MRTSFLFNRSDRADAFIRNARALLMTDMHSEYNAKVRSYVVSVPRQHSDPRLESLARTWGVTDIVTHEEASCTVH